MMLLTKLLFIWTSSFRGKYFFWKSTNQKQELPVAAMFLIGSERNEQSLQRTFHRCFLPSFGAFGQAVSDVKIFFRNQPIRNKNCLWRPCLIIDRDKMSISVEDLPQMLVTKFWFIWPCAFRGKDFLEINQSETRIACGDHVSNRIGAK